jgi:SOS-response transcriptional repressor LexA
LNNFNEKLFSNLLVKAKGSKTLTKYAADAGIDPGYLSQFINMKRKNPPSEQVLFSLAAGADNNVTFEEFLYACGFSKESNESILKEMSKFQYAKLHALINYYKKEYKTTDESSMNQTNNIATEPLLVPIFKDITPDGVILSVDSIDGYDYQYINPTKEHTNKLLFYIKIQDNSMVNSRIHIGDLALISAQDQVDNGDISLVILESGEVTLRRVYKDTQSIIFCADDSKSAPVFYKESELKKGKIKILGKVIQVKFNL